MFKRLVVPLWKGGRLQVAVLIGVLIWVMYGEPDADIIYIENFLPPEQANQLLDYLNNKHHDFLNEKYRLAEPLTSDEDRVVYQMFYSASYLQKIRSYVGGEIRQSEFPIEYRRYPTGSEGMFWHRDKVLYDIPQYEAVYTVDNSSDSMTEWVGEDGKLHHVWTKPNSLLLVKAGGLNHHVTPINKGSRGILKLIYARSLLQTDAYKKETQRFFAQ